MPRTQPKSISTAGRPTRLPVAILVAVTTLAAGTACAEQPDKADGDAVPVAKTAPESTGKGRGSLLSVTPLAKLSRTQVADALTKNGVETGTVRHSVRTYRLTYRTLTADGRKTRATGLLALPADRGARLDLVSETHGTMANRRDAPSVSESFGRLPAVLHAAAGRAVSAPDYPGLGKGPGLHPYMDTQSSVAASLDMLRATRTAATRLGRTMSRDVYLSGFSQGGQVAMGLAKALHQSADRTFTLRALAPVSGPYDLQHAEIPGLFDGSINDTSAVFYLSYFLTSQNRQHRIYRDPSEVFRAPYDTVVEDLFDTRHSEEEIVGALPATMKELITNDFLRELRRPKGGLLASLKAQDGRCAWKPDVPVRLYSSSGDTDVPIANSRHCARDLAAHGAQVPVLDQGTLNHNSTFKKSAPKIVEWFDTLR